MDFHSLSRRDLQFFCKKNKIPANITNIAMADSLKSLEIVEGIDEFVNQSPTSVAKNLTSAARTAARTTRRKTTKDETQSSELVTRSCHVISKSLSGEMDQENRNMNVLQNPSLPPSRRRAAATSIAMNMDATDMKPETNVRKTPVARSTRRDQVAASSKKVESVQRVYSTRRSVKLLEESMADLSLKTKDSLNVPAKKNEDDKREDSPDSPADSKFQANSDDNSEETKEAEVISVRDLNDSLEKEWAASKNDPDVDILYGDLGDITFFDANISKEQMNGIESNNVPASDNCVIVEEKETSKDDDFVVVDHAASTITKIVVCNKETESGHMKTDSESETDPWDDDDSDVAFETNQEAFGSTVSATDNVSKVDSIPIVLMMDESDSYDSEESEPEEEESCESDELIDNESEAALVSDKMKTQASSCSYSPRAVKEVESDSDEWSDFEISDIEENSCESEEVIQKKSLEVTVSDKKAPYSPLNIVGSKIKTQLTPFEAEAISDPNKSVVKLDLTEDNKNKENVVERKAEAEAEKKKKKKKRIDEESLKDVSVRQLTKMLKELGVKSKQQHMCVD